MTDRQPSGERLPMAVILAAGAGRRLAPLTDDRPKPMVEIEGEPILRRMLNALESAGFQEVTIVTGHRSELIDAFAADRSGSISITRLRNPDYASTNTVGSFAFVADRLGDGFCLLNGDLVFEPTLLDDLAAAGPGTHLVTDLDEPLGDEEMKVEVDGEGLVVRISKGLPPGIGVGEFTGISRFDRNGAAAMIAAARRLMSEGRQDAYYEDAFNLVALEIGAKLVPTRRRPWTEIDDIADYHRAVGIVRDLNRVQSGS